MRTAKRHRGLGDRAVMFAALFDTVLVDACIKVVEIAPRLSYPANRGDQDCATRPSRAGL